MSNHTASLTYVGLDVHADTITVAVAEGSSRARGRGVVVLRKWDTLALRELPDIGPFRPAPRKPALCVFNQNWFFAIFLKLQAF